MELWQMDVVGGVLLSGGGEAKILTGIDDHSRFVVCASLMLRATSRAVCAHFAEAMRRHGTLGDESRYCYPSRPRCRDARS
jgi:transposase InsO family protein